MTDSIHLSEQTAEFEAVKESLRKLNGLYSDAHPGLVTWVIAVCKAWEELDSARAKYSEKIKQEITR